MNKPDHKVIFRFDIFKGAPDEEGKIKKIRSVGCAVHENGSEMVKVKLKTFPNVEFFMTAEDSGRENDFVILTKSFADNPSKNISWNVVGNGKTLTDSQQGLVQLRWDLLSCDAVYLDLSGARVSAKSAA